MIYDDLLDRNLLAENLLIEEHIQMSGFFHLLPCLCLYNSSEVKKSRTANLLLLLKQR